MPAHVPPMVYLVGAGPGDPRLLTLRGAEVLGEADVVLYDGLSNPAILRHARDAECICVGKHGQSRIWTQEEINEAIVRYARAGRRVVRLKGGDPAIFARTAEEVAAVREAGLAFEIVPGITAALAAGSYAGIPVTHRGLASAVALVTGHEEPSKESSALDWHALARFPGTLVIYMGVTTAPVWTAALIDAGMSPETPAAILRRCSLPDQQMIRCRLAEVAEHLSSRMRPPVIVILGRVSELADTMSWFSSRPLFGHRILVTRPADQAHELATPLEQLGAEVLFQPVIAIEPAEDTTSLDEGIDEIDQYNVITFSSTNGVRYFFDRVFAFDLDARLLAGMQVAAVGAKTADKLAEYHVRADLVPYDYSAAALVEALAPQAHDLRVLVVRASRSADTLVEGLRRSGAKVAEAIAYEHRDVTEADPQVREAMRDGAVTWTTVTSSASARSLVAMFGEDLRNTRLASLSPLTSAAIRELGFEPAAEATAATMERLVDAILLADLTLAGEPPQ